MALKIIDHGSPEYQQMVKLREDVLRRPLGLGFTSEELESEKENMLEEVYEQTEKDIDRGENNKSFNHDLIYQNLKSISSAFCPDHSRTFFSVA